MTPLRLHGLDHEGWNRFAPSFSARALVCRIDLDTSSVPLEVEIGVGDFRWPTPRSGVRVDVVDPDPSSDLLRAASDWHGSGDLPGLDVLPEVISSVVPSSTRSKACPVCGHPDLQVLHLGEILDLLGQDPDGKTGRWAEISSRLLRGEWIGLRCGVCLGGFAGPADLGGDLVHLEVST